MAINMFNGNIKVTHNRLHAKPVIGLLKNRGSITLTLPLG